MLGSYFYNLLSNLSIPSCSVSIPPGVTAPPPAQGCCGLCTMQGRGEGLEEAEQPGAAQPVSFGGFLQVQTGPCTVPWEHPARLLTHTVQDGHVSSTNIS